MQLESCIGNPDALRMIPLGTHAPLQLNLGRWKKTLCPTKIGINNDVTTNESLMSLHYPQHSFMHDSRSFIFEARIERKRHYTSLRTLYMHISS